MPSPFDSEQALQAFIRAEVDRRLGDVTTLKSQTRRGAGSPETVVTAPIGTLYLQTDGGAATTLWVKESGAAAVGWVAK